MIELLTSLQTLAEQGEDHASIEACLGPGTVNELIDDLQPGSLVVPRYRAIPFGDLLEREVAAHGCTLINSYRQHRNIADSSNWIHLLDHLTPPAYSLHQLPDLPEGEWFVKGETNSLKHRWQQACYAPTTRDLITIVNTFQNDSLLGNQKIVIKPFVRFRQLLDAVGQPIASISGQPIWHERRVFVLDNQPLTQGFYWTNFTDDAVGNRDITDAAAFQATLAETIARVGHLARFWVVDLAECVDGRWMVIELNDGCMAGLSDTDPTALWTNFARVINGDLITLTT